MNNSILERNKNAILSNRAAEPSGDQPNHFLWQI